MLLSTACRVKVKGRYQWVLRRDSDGDRIYCGVPTIDAPFPFDLPEWRLEIVCLGGISALYIHNAWFHADSVLLLIRNSDARRLRQHIHIDLEG